MFLAGSSRPLTLLRQPNHLEGRRSPIPPGDPPTCLGSHLCLFHLYPLRVYLLLVSLVLSLPLPLVFSPVFLPLFYLYFFVLITCLRFSVTCVFCSLSYLCPFSITFFLCPFSHLSSFLSYLCVLCPLSYLCSFLSYLCHCCSLSHLSSLFFFFFLSLSSVFSFVSSSAFFFFLFFFYWFYCLLSYFFPIPFLSPTFNLSCIYLFSTHCFVIFFHSFLSSFISCPFFPTFHKFLSPVASCPLLTHYNVFFFFFLFFWLSSVFSPCHFLPRRLECQMRTSMCHFYFFGHKLNPFHWILRTLHQIKYITVRFIYLFIHVLL